MIRTMVGCILLWSFGAVTPGYADAAAADQVRAHIEKTYASENLTTFKVSASYDGHGLDAIYTQYRSVNSSSEENSNGLSYRPHDFGKNPANRQVQHVLLAAIMQRLESEFGDNLTLTYFTASGYLSADNIEKENFLAFHNYKPWLDYVQSPTPHLIPQMDTHNMVVQRWKQKGVYDDVIGIFKSLGYELQLQGFEKLFVFRADKSAIYSDLLAKGIKPHERFPYPGIVHFSIRKMDTR